MNTPSTAALEEYADKASTLLRQLPDGDATVFADNLAVAMTSVGEDIGRWPVSVVDDEDARDLAWVVSAHTAYCRYASEEMRRHFPGLPALAAEPAIRAVGAWLRHARIDRAVTLNQWLLSTNLYPPFDGAILRRNIDEALQRWPDHALWLRSLNPSHHASWLRALQEAGFVLLPSRQVYLLDDPDAAARRHRDLHNDLRLLRPERMRQAELEMVGDDAFDEAGYEAAAELYSCLYISKYSACNPRYSVAFMRAWHRAGLLVLRGFRDMDGQWLGVGGAFNLGGVSSSPVVGYDTSQPLKRGLYRRITAALLSQARERGLRINFSGGSAYFKRQRGSRAEIEYSAVHVRHLPAFRQRGVSWLAGLCQRLAVPLMRRWEL
ncbi:MAG: hypothetical protein LBL59_10005 [Xanthomonadaceae bacterium]|nr:hypothetical protein [Xanthomonadaceae bacterium]